MKLVRAAGRPVTCPAPGAVPVAGAGPVGGLAAAAAAAAASAGRPGTSVTPPSSAALASSSRSAADNSSASAISRTVDNLGAFRRPCSIAAIVAGLIRQRAARASWVRLAATRNLRSNSPKESAMQEYPTRSR